MELTHKQLSVALLALFIISLVLALPARAEEVRTDANITVHATGSAPFSRENRDELKAKMLERRTMIEQKIASGTAQFRGTQNERREEWRAKAKTRMGDLFGNMKTRMYTLIERMEGFITRIESRAQKMEDAGANTADAETYLSEAKTALENAKDILATTMDADVTITVDAENPKEAFGAIREKIGQVQAYLKSAHGAIRNAIEALKQAARDADLNAKADARVEVRAE